jgi:hypothetical protein
MTIYLEPSVTVECELSVTRCRLYGERLVYIDDIN